MCFAQSVLPPGANAGEERLVAFSQGWRDAETHLKWDGHSAGALSR